VAGLALTFAVPVRADDSATEQARKHYETGTQQYDLGHWDDAIREFEKAYELRPDPSFLYNLAQANRRKGDLKRALDLYKNYLIKIPKGPQRAEVEEKIAALQKQIDEAAAPKPVAPGLEPSAAPTAPAPIPSPAVPEQTATPSVAPPGTGPGPQAETTAASPPVTQPDQGAPVATPPGTTTTPVPAAAATTSTLPAPPRGRSLRIAGIACGAVGLVSLGTGVAFGLRARSLSDKVSGAATFNPSDDSNGQQAAKLQWVFYGVGAGVAATGAVLYYLGVRAARTPPSGLSLGPVVGPGTAGVSAMGVF